jgi:hypothetical protein
MASSFASDARTSQPPLNWFKGRKNPLRETQPAQYTFT